MNIRLEFAKRLQFIRKHRGMTQDALSIAAKIDRSYLSEVENGKSAPTLDAIDRLAHALDIHPAEFFVFSVREPKKHYG